MDSSIEPLWDRHEVAKALNVSVEALDDWRKTGAVKLPYVPLGPRLIRYRRADVQAFIDAGLQPAPVST